MAKFRFRLQSLLGYRKQREEEALRALGGAQRAYQAALNAKAGLLVELEDALVRRERLGEEAVSIEAFRIEQSFIVGTRQRIVQSEQAIFRATKAVEKALRAYLGARKQSRMLETIRDKDYAKFRKDLADREQKRIDDFMIMRHRMGDGLFGEVESA